MSINRHDVDAMLLREWANAGINRRREDMQRLALRATDKVLQEFELQGFSGFQVTRNADGSLDIEGTPANPPNYGRAP